MVGAVRESGNTRGKVSPLQALVTSIGRKQAIQVPPGRRTRRYTIPEDPSSFSLVERGGKVRPTQVTGKFFAGIKLSLKNNVSDDAVLMTDSARFYRNIAKRFADDQTVNHNKDEYVRGDAHINTVEGYFSVFKRGVIGTYQHCKWTVSGVTAGCGR
jgi:hypothetical protein